MDKKGKVSYFVIFLQKIVKTIFFKLNKILQNIQKKVSQI